MRRLLHRGYSLIEVLASTVVIGIGMTAAVTMSSTMIVQEEMSWRVNIGVNYQENAVRLWQLGLDRADILRVLPTNPMLNDILINTTAGIPVTLGNTAEVSSLMASLLENAATSSTLRNYASAATDGATVITDAYRPRIR
jgi:prepilin-type N-terminal cleavage/methylation domain-containing protein